MSDDVLAGYLTGWLDGDPQRATAWLFLRADERTYLGALAVLQDEWTKVLRDVREPQVALAKLGWWREEVLRAAQGQASHPLTRALFVHARVQQVPTACWIAAVDALLLAVNLPTPTDAPAQLAAEQPLARAFAELETSIWFGPSAERARAVQVIAIAHLVTRLRGLGGAAQGRFAPLPMNLLARHGLALDDLVADTPSRRAAVRDHAAFLAQALAGAATMAGPLGLFRAVALRHDLLALQQAAQAEAPLAALHKPERGFRHLLKTWQAARIWRGYRITEAIK